MPLAAITLLLLLRFFSTIAVAQNIRDAKQENNSKNEAIANQALQSDAQAL